MLFVHVVPLVEVEIISETAIKSARDDDHVTLTQFLSVMVRAVQLVPLEEVAHTFVPTATNKEREDDHATEL